MSERKPRGEIAELSATLQNLCMAGRRADKDLRAARKEAFKKVINYMTLGMDMSPLFPMMISCANLSSDDIVLKKMLYLYINHYSTQTPDLALLTINQLHKDCKDQDPTVRGLALRSLCSLRVANLLEYLLSPINAGLEDQNPYVRRTAVMGVLKAWHLDKSSVLAQGMLEKVQHVLQHESDPQVVANCLSVLLQIEGSKKLTDKAKLFGLLNRLKEFSDWAQCAVLEVCAQFQPESEQEVYDILEFLEDRMSHVNSAIVMAAVKVFLHLTLDMPATHQQVLERIKEPMKTLMSRDNPATVYPVLSHILVMVQRAPMIFENDYTSFYCRTHDPWYIKKQKMEILTAIANSSNVYEIVMELWEYSKDLNEQIARESVKAISRIALSVPDVNGIVERLLMFLESGTDHIMAETLIQLKDLLRRYPDLADFVSTTLGDISFASVQEPAARASLIWIMGQHGQNIQDAPYLLEPLADSFSSEAPEVKLALLTAGVQLYFKRPPESQKLLGKLLHGGINDSNQDVHDRALLYYRLMKCDVHEAERVINPPPSVINYFSEAMSEEMKDKVFSEFNTLSVVYQSPASMFVEQQAYHQAEEEESVAGVTDAYVDDGAVPLVSASAETSLLDDDLLGLDGDAAMPSSTGDTTASSGQPESTGLLGIDALLDLNGFDAVPSSQAAAPPPPPSLSLTAQAKIAPAAFQERWRSWPAAHQYTETLTPATISALPMNNHKDFTQHMTQAYIMTMASGGQTPMFRYYFYAQAEDSGSLFLVEMIVNTNARQANITVKTDAASSLQAFVELWSMCLTGFFR